MIDPEKGTELLTPMKLDLNRILIHPGKLRDYLWSTVGVTHDNIRSHEFN
jgi:hypothetical protein